MKLLITGCRGQLGTELLWQLAAGGSALGPLPVILQGAQVTGVDIDAADLSKLAETHALVLREAPNVVINCAAFTNVDGAEQQPDAAFAANAVAPRNLAMACHQVGAKLLHLSTDYVLSGTGSTPADEGTVPAPQSVYGTTKLLGEQYVREFADKWFIIRTAWLYGRTGGNFVKTMLRLAAQRDELAVVDDQRGNPTNAEDLAHHLLLLAATEEYGLYHCTGNGECSWADFAAEIMRLAGKTTKIKPVSTADYLKLQPQQARRPAYSALAHTMLRATVGDHMRSWQEALAAYITELKETGEM